MNLRGAAHGRIERPSRRPLGTDASTDNPIARDKAWLRGAWADVDVYRRDGLSSGDRIDGPAIVLEDACTTLVLPGWETVVSTHGHLLISKVG